MKSNKRFGTRPELILSKHLGKKRSLSNLPGSPDFVYYKERLAIFVHGCFWHRCPIHANALPKTNREFWRRKFKRNLERDRLNREELTAMGWSAIEVWEHELREDAPRVAQRIRRLIASRYEK